MTRQKKLLINTAVGLGSQFITILCGLILPAAILRAFGSSANGLVNSIGQFLGFISLCDLGVGAVVQSALYKPLADGDNYTISCIFRSSSRFFKIVGTILIVYVTVLCLLYPALISEYGRLYVVMMIVAISINSFANYYIGMTNSLLLQADQKAFIPLGLQAVTIVLNTVSSLLLIHFGASLLVIKYVTAALYLIRPVAMSMYVKKHYHIDKNVEYTEEPIKQKWNGLAQHFSSVIVDHTDTVVLTMFAPLSSVSVYGVYFMVVSSVRNMIFSSLSGVQATMGNMLSRNETKELNSFFSKIEWLLHTCTTLLFTVTGILIVPFVTIYTKNVSDVNYNVPLFSALIVTANAGFVLQFIYKLLVKAAGHYKETQWSAVMEAVINVCVSVILVIRYGLVGVAIGTILAMGYRLLYHVWYLKNNIVFRGYYYFAKHIVVDGLTVVGIIVLSSVITINADSFTKWVGSAIIVSVIAVIVSLVLNFIFYRYYTIGFINRLFKSIRGGKINGVATKTFRTLSDKKKSGSALEE